MLLTLAFLPWMMPTYAQDDSNKWTFMVYMDADNNLDSAALSDIIEMQAVGSSSEIEIVVLLDRWGEMCGFNGSTVLYVEQGGNQTVWGEWSDDHELNMGDPETLTWFINYTVENYPAEKYALILWDHGGNWEGVCWDWTNDDYLTIEEVKQALADSIIGKVDLLGFDACLMASLEVAYSMKLSGKVGVMVASEDSIPWYGWPYDMILKTLAEMPEWNEYEFSINIVNEYIASYSKVGWCKVMATLSAIDVMEIDLIVDQFADLTSELLSNFNEYKSAITDGENGADRHWFGVWHQGPYIDLYHFVDRLGQTENLKPYADQILNSWSNLVVYSKSSNGPHNRGGEGLTIYFPRNRNYFYTPEPYYESISELADATDWHILLATYFAK